MIQPQVVPWIGILSSRRTVWPLSGRFFTFF